MGGIARREALTNFEIRSKQYEKELIAYQIYKDAFIETPGMEFAFSCTECGICNVVNPTILADYDVFVLALRHVSKLQVGLVSPCAGAIAVQAHILPLWPADNAVSFCLLIHTKAVLQIGCFF